MLSFFRKRLFQTHLENNSVTISDAFMMGLYDKSTATRLRLIKPVRLPTPAFIHAFYVNLIVFHTV